jgi:hypothetical protein
MLVPRRRQSFRLGWRRMNQTSNEGGGYEGRERSGSAVPRTRIMRSNPGPVSTRSSPVLTHGHLCPSSQPSEIILPFSVPLSAIARRICSPYILGESALQWRYSHTLPDYALPYILGGHYSLVSCLTTNHIVWIHHAIKMRRTTHISYLAATSGRCLRCQVSPSGSGPRGAAQM